MGLLFLHLVCEAKGNSLITVHNLWQFKYNDLSFFLKYLFGLRLSLGMTLVFRTGWELIIEVTLEKGVTLSCV